MSRRRFAFVFVPRRDSLLKTHRAKNFAGKSMARRAAPTVVFITDLAPPTTPSPSAKRHHSIAPDRASWTTHQSPISNRGRRPQSRFGFALYPAGTVFLGVIDPGRHSRKAIIVKTKKEQYFVVPDNGPSRPPSIATARNLPRNTNTTWCSRRVSSTFHGATFFLRPPRISLRMGLHHRPSRRLSTRSSAPKPASSKKRESPRHQSASTIPSDRSSRYPGRRFSRARFTSRDRSASSSMAKPLVLPFGKTFMNVPVANRSFIKIPRGRIGTRSSGHYSKKFGVEPPEPFHSRKGAKRLISNTPRIINTLYVALFFRTN